MTATRRVMLNPRELLDSTVRVRKIYPGIDELAESMRAPGADGQKRGVLEPLMARPTGDGYELIFGHRRKRAAIKAELTEVPVDVRPMTDAEVLEVQIVENLQREGIHPLEEADDYRAVLSWEEASKTVTGAARHDNGSFAVADPRFPEAPPVCIVHDPRKAPLGRMPIIIAADGTWHRPVTTLELAVIQDLPTQVDGRPLALHGTSSSGHRQRIGNAVPVGAATAIATRMLVTLLEASLGAFSLAGTDTPVWVDRREEAFS